MSGASPIMPVSQETLILSFAAIDHSQTTPGMVCLGTFLGETLISMHEVSPTTLDLIQRVDWNAIKCRLTLPSISHSDRSVRSVLCAMVPVGAMVMAEGAGAKPVSLDEITAATMTDHQAMAEKNSLPTDAASAPKQSLDEALAKSAKSTRFETAMAQHSLSDPEKENIVPGKPIRFTIANETYGLIPLGSIVRLAVNREHPDSPRDEAHAMLKSILRKQVMTLADKIIENEGLS